MFRSEIHSTHSHVAAWCWFQDQFKNHNAGHHVTVKVEIDSAEVEVLNQPAINH